MVRAKLDDLAVASDGSYFLMLISSEEGEVLPISIGPLEAHAIAAGRAEEKFSRPLTHDLFHSVLQLLDATLARVEITDLKDGVYYAKLVLESRGVEFEIDARPSDAVALMVRSNAPLFVSRKVLDEGGHHEDFGGSGGVEA